MENTRPQAPNPPTRRAQHHPAPPIRHRRTEQSNPSQEGTSTGTTSMDVDTCRRRLHPMARPLTTTQNTDKEAPPQWTHPREFSPALFHPSLHGVTRNWQHHGQHRPPNPTTTKRTPSHYQRSQEGRTGGSGSYRGRGTPHNGTRSRGCT